MICMFSNTFSSRKHSPSIFSMNPTRAVGWELNYLYDIDKRIGYELFSIFKNKKDPMSENKSNENTKAKIIARAWKDEIFRDLLINNPKEALKEYDIEIPENVEMKVLCEDKNHLFFVLPQLPIETKSLSSDELEHMSAGGGVTVFAPTCVFGSCAEGNG